MSGNPGIANSPALNLEVEEVEIFEATGGSFDGARVYIEGSGDFFRGGNVGKVATGGKFVEIEPKSVLRTRKMARSHEFKKIERDLDKGEGILKVAKFGYFLHNP